MKNTILNIIHSFGSIVILAIPVLLQQHFSWENMTVGAILNAIYLYFVKQQAVSGALREAGLR